MSREVVVVSGVRTATEGARLKGPPPRTGVGILRRRRRCPPQRAASAARCWTLAPPPQVPASKVLRVDGDSPARSDNCC